MTGPACGAKQRIKEMCRYRPSSIHKARRPARVVNPGGKTQTYKRKGDLMINGTTFEVPKSGWY